MAPSQEEYFSVDMEFITADKQLTADSPDDTDLLDSIDFLLDDQAEAVVSADDEFDESLLSPEEPSSTASTSNGTDDGDDAMQVDASNLISLHKSIQKQQNMLLKHKRQNSLSDLSSYSNNTTSSSLPYNSNSTINDTMSPTEQYNQALQNLAESMRRTEISRKQVMQFQHTSLSPEQQGMLALAKERLRQQNQMVVSSSMMAENCSLLKDVRSRLSSGFGRCT